MSPQSGGHRPPPFGKKCTPRGRRVGSVCDRFVVFYFCAVALGSTPTPSLARNERCFVDVSFVWVMFLCRSPPPTPPGVKRNLFETCRSTPAVSQPQPFEAPPPPLSFCVLFVSACFVVQNSFCVLCFVFDPGLKRIRFVFCVLIVWICFSVFRGPKSEMTPLARNESVFCCFCLDMFHSGF